MLFTIFSVGTSSDSEEEIVFQRKNRKKKNVLESPDVSLRKTKRKDKKSKITRKSITKTKILCAIILISVYIGYER